MRELELASLAKAEELEAINQTLSKVLADITRFKILTSFYIQNILVL